MGMQRRLDLGRRMKEAAKAAGLTSGAIGEKIGVEDGTVRGWWRGRNQPNPQKLQSYAQAVGASVDYLLAGDGETINGFEAEPDLSRVSNEALAAELERRLVGRR